MITTPAKNFLADFNASVSDEIQAIKVDVAFLSHNDTDMELLAIWSRGVRRKGHGTMALRKICSLADKHSVQLSLEVLPCQDYDSLDSKDYSEDELLSIDLSSVTPSEHELAAWYGKHGFVLEDPLGVVFCAKMIRTPQ